MTSRDTNPFLQGSPRTVWIVHGILVTPKDVSFPPYHTTRTYITRKGVKRVLADNPTATVMKAKIAYERCNPNGIGDDDDHQD
jgi:hypothetical protein